MKRIDLWEKITGEKFHRGGPNKIGDPVKRRSFTCTDEEWEKVEQLAFDAGLSTSAYIRLLIIKDGKEGGIINEFTEEAS